MSGLSFFAAGQLLAASVAAPRYLALLTDLVTQDDDGSTLSEPSFGGYARPAIPPAGWTVPAQGAIANSVTVPLPTPSSGRIQIVAAALCDAPTHGQIWWVLDTFTFVLDAQDPSPALPPGYLVLALPWMAGP